MPSAAYVFPLFQLFVIVGMRHRTCRRFYRDARRQRLHACHTLQELGVSSTGCFLPATCPTASYPIPFLRHCFHRLDAPNQTTIFAKLTTKLLMFRQRPRRYRHHGQYNSTFTLRMAATRSIQLGCQPKSVRYDGLRRTSLEELSISLQIR
jgi:hypothetical protein